MDYDLILYYFIVFLAIFILLFGVFYILKTCYDSYVSYSAKYKETYDFSTAILIDTHLSYNRFGTPCYYFVYEFSSGAIKQIQVSEGEYYSKMF